MRKINKKFIALLMVFTSVVSFLPVGFSGQEAKADVLTDASTSRINVDGSSTSLTRRTDSTINEEIYNTKSLESAFDISVKNVSKATNEWVADSKNQKTSITGVIGQKVILQSINGTKLVTSDGVTPNQAGYDIVKGMGINVSGNLVSDGSVSNDSQLNSISTDSNNTNVGPIQVDGINDPRIGVRIQDLPAGVDKITYTVQVDTIAVTYTPTLDSNGNPTTSGTAAAGSVATKTVSKSITIEHGSDYAISKIDSMLFKAYVGDATAFDSTDTIQDSTKNKNNTVPFLYLTTTKPDSNMALRYKFDVPDSLSALKYVMTFGNMLQLNNGIDLYKNGVKAAQGTDYSLSGQSLTGDLSNPNQADLIVIRVKSVNSTSTGTSTTTNISKAYSIEIRYNKLSSDKDYSLSKAGITKLNYDSNTGVEAYIGKTFTVTENSSGFKEYTGNIYIDPRAEMISIDPTLIRDKSTVAYVVTNNYVDSTGTTRVKKSVLKNGKQFIDFMASTSKNQLQVDVYPGQNGSVTDSSTILARYILNVNQESSSSFSMGLTFGTTGVAAVYLTQPGVKENVINNFTTDRRTYDLYYGSPDVDTVKVTFSGTRSSLNEYIRVWLADDVDSSNLTEAQASVNNTPQSNNSNLRNESLNVNVGTAKKMVVQAYYDEFQYNTDGSAKLGSDGNQVYNSYPVGDTYVFYLPENYTSTTPSAGEQSSDASLILLKASGYTLTDSNGKTGFSTSVFDYSTTVNKDDTTVKLTATANDDNVKSIVASINGSDQTYTLGSGEEEELPLNSSGTTTIKILVTAQDGSTTQTYSVVVSNNTKSSNANLKNVILNVGDYTFDPSADVTKVRVDPNVTSIKVTPIPEDSKSTASVNGDTYSSTAITVSLKGSQKTEISIEVTSEDGEQSKTYILDIYRVDTASWEDSSDSSSSDTDDQYYDEYNDTWVDLSKYEEWGTVNGKPAYFDKHNRQVKNSWISTGGKYYYLNNLGYRASGWKVDSTTGQSYYLDTTTGEMKKGWINLNNTWYYLDLNGVMHKGWLYLNGKWYYFTPNGQMVINQSMYIDNKSYMFGQDGAVTA